MRRRGVAASRRRGVAASRAIGARDVIVKPFGPLSLSARIGALLSG